MEPQGHKKLVLVDAYTRCCLTAIVVLLSVLIVGLWADGVPLARNAGAADQVRYQPRSALEIGDMVRTQEQTNDKLDQIIKLLESGSAKIQLIQAPEAPTGGKSSEPPQPQTKQAGE